jgi:uncharacterized protein
MTSGLIALLDDITALAKVAATSLDDATAMAARAGGKAAGLVIDDAAVTPRYVVGLASERELPIIWKISLGSLKNKLLFLLPGALVLSLLAPWIITPLLMIGGAFLCMEGFHKVMDIIQPGHKTAADAIAQPLTAEELENERVSSAIRTDFILSAEIMAITLASVSTSPLWMQALVLGVVGIGMTVLVYGAVALIVKADDAGVALAGTAVAPVRVLGRFMVKGMPYFLKTLSFVGMIAMLWVGGGILVHGLHELGVHGPEAALHHAGEAVAKSLPSAHATVMWLTQAGISAVIGLVVGALVDPIAKHLISPLLARFAKKNT